MSSSLVTVDTSHDPIVVITMNRPEKRNALSVQLMTEMIGAIQEHQKNCRAMVFAAKGPVFCAGMDLQEKDVALGTVEKLFQTVAAIPCPTFCAIQGDVLAGGVGIVLASDFAVMAKGAHVSLPEVKKGIVPTLVGRLLLQQIARKHARELLVFGDKIDAMRAFHMGIVNAVVEGDVLEEVLARARGVCEDDPAVIQGIKRMLSE